MNMSKKEKIEIVFLMRITGQNKGNMKIIMRKYIIHFTIWLIGLLINMFVLEYIFELYDNLFISHILVIGSIIILFIFRKYIKSFWTENLWNRHLTIVFFAFNILISALISLLGVICEDFVLVEVDSISVKYKVMLIIIYILVFKITQMPDSVFIKFSSKNADILENSELGRK